MSIERIAWGEALRIPGAQAVIVTAIDTRRPLRLDTVESFPSGESVAEVAAALAETAAELVRLTDAGAAMDDLLVTAPTWFHVLRIFDGEEAGECVAHLVLDRRVANLAMARRDLRGLLGRPRARSVPGRDRPATDLPQRMPGANLPRAEQHRDEPSAWFATVADTPFQADVRTIRRVRDGLRRLPDEPAAGATA
jgi:hypothetical protein